MSLLNSIIKQHQNQSLLAGTLLLLFGCLYGLSVSVLKTVLDIFGVVIINSDLRNREIFLRVFVGKDEKFGRGLLKDK